MSATLLPQTPPPSDPRRDIYAVVRAIAFLGFIGFLLWLAGDVLLLLFAGVLVAIFIDGIATWIRGRLKTGHAASIALALAILTISFGIVAIFSAPDIAEQVDQFSVTFPQAVDNLHRQLDRYRWVKVLLDQIPTASDLRSPEIGLVRKATGALNVTVVILARIVLIGFVGLFLALQPGMYRRGVLRLVPISRRERASEVLDAVGANLRSWLVGKVLSGIAIGVATWVGLQVLGIPLALMLALLAALTSFIPNFGPIIAMIPAMLLALMQGLTQALYVGLLYVVIQLVETYLLTPWLAHRTASIPPALTMLGQILLGVLFGGMGVIMAAPATAAAMVLVRMLYVEDVLGDRVPEATIPEKERALP